jgi:diguanylate cyclase (GGDEF)-like protein
MASDAFPASPFQLHPGLDLAANDVTANLLPKCADAARLSPRPPSADMKVSSLPEDLMGIIGRLQALIREQDAVIQSQAEALSHTRQIFERASVAAKIGVWQCDLSDDSLTWSDVVYDLFDAPRGSVLDRASTVECYTPKSREALHTLRSQAIAERSGFTLDAEIITPKGRQRWIRLTATVQCENGVAVRIFGMKQDITDEKILADRTRYLAEFDSMTGLANRHRFEERLGSIGATGSVGSLFLVDLDGFKQINDTFGHALGDECLIEMARRLSQACDGADLVARIGGDEFAVLLDARLTEAAVLDHAARIVESLSRPVECTSTTLSLSASVGIALVKDCAPADLFRNADSALYAAKAAGRNTFRLFSGGA